MRTYDEYHQILELWEQGIPKQRIGIILNIPRGTVTDCIKRYSSLVELEANKDRAMKGTSDGVLARIHNPENIEVQKPMRMSWVSIWGMAVSLGYEMFIVCV